MPKTTSSYLLAFFNDHWRIPRLRSEEIKTDDGECDCRHDKSEKEERLHMNLACAT